MNSYIGEILGYLAGLCTAVCFLPQTIQSIKSRNTSGLSLLSYVIYCTGVISWILYGIYLSSLQMILFNSISLFFALIILYMIITERFKK